MRIENLRANWICLNWVDFEKIFIKTLSTSFIFGMQWFKIQSPVAFMVHEVFFSVETTYHTDHIGLWMQHWKIGVFVCILLSSGEFCNFHDLIQTHSKNGWRWSNLFGKRITKCKCWKFYRLRWHNLSSWNFGQLLLFGWNGCIGSEKERILCSKLL